MITMAVFAATLLPGGHGVIPLGLLLLLLLPFIFGGSLTSFAALFGWLAIACLLVMPWIVGVNRYFIAAGTGLPLLLVSWILFYAAIEVQDRSMISPIPFLTIFVITSAWHVVSFRKHRGAYPAVKR